MGDLNERIDELADLMDEFGLEKAELKGKGWVVGFDRSPPALVNGVPSDDAQTDSETRAEKVEAPKGTPVTSPMTGIYYAAPSPGAPDFVKQGDQVAAGQVVGLIEAMKVFNEITAVTAGTVTAITAEAGQLVQPGDALIYIE